MGRPKRVSVAWNFFEQDGGRVTCTLCCKGFKFFGNTTNLRTHLARKHPIQWQLASNGAIDDSLLCNSNEDDDETSSEATVSRRKRKFEYHQIPSVDDLGNEDIIVMEELRNSDEEWLEDTEPIGSPDSSYKPKKKTPKKKIKKEKLDHYEDFPQIANSSMFVTDSVNAREIAVSEKDEHASFGEYIGNKIRNFKDPKTRGNVQQLITTILWQAEYGVYNDSEAVKKILMMSLNPTTTSKTPKASIVISYADKTVDTQSQDDTDVQEE